MTRRKCPFHRQGGGIEPLCVSTPHGLKPCPSTSLTHPGRSRSRLANAEDARKHPTSKRAHLVRSAQDQLRSRGAMSLLCCRGAAQLRCALSRMPVSPGLAHQVGGSFFRLRVSSSVLIVFPCGMLTHSFDCLERVQQQVDAMILGPQPPAGWDICGLLRLWTLPLPGPSAEKKGRRRSREGAACAWASAPS